MAKLKQAQTIDDFIRNLCISLSISKGDVYDENGQLDISMLDFYTNYNRIPMLKIKIEQCREDIERLNDELDEKNDNNMACEKEVPYGKYKQCAEKLSMKLNETINKSWD